MKGSVSRGEREYRSAVDTWWQVQKEGLHLDLFIQSWLLCLDSLTCVCRLAGLNPRRPLLNRGSTWELMLFTDNSWENPFEVVDILTNTPDFGLSWLNLVEDMSTQHLDQKTQSKCLQLAQELTPYSKTRWTIGMGLCRFEMSTCEKNRGQWLKNPAESCFWP